MQHDRGPRFAQTDAPMQGTGVNARFNPHPPEAEYSWDSLPSRRKREVLDMVNSAHGKRRTQLIGLLVLLVLTLGALTAAYIFFA